MYYHKRYKPKPHIHMLAAEQLLMQKIMEKILILNYPYWDKNVGCANFVSQCLWRCNFPLE